MKQHKIDSYMIGIAKLTAAMSKCNRLKVGAVFAKDGRPLATGWNGMLEGSFDDCCEETLECDHCTDGMNHPGTDICPKCKGTRRIIKSKDSVIHAEMNALRFMAKEGISTKGATLYITHAPCINCAKHIAGIGLEKVVYLNDYRSSEGLEHLEDFGVIVEKCNERTETH